MEPRSVYQIRPLVRRPRPPSTAPATTSGT